jgi:hypothetical protein
MAVAMTLADRFQLQHLRVVGPHRAGVDRLQPFALQPPLQALALAAIELILGRRDQVRPPPLDAADDRRNAALRQVIVLGESRLRSSLDAIRHQDRLVAAAGRAFLAGERAVVGFGGGKGVGDHGSLRG